MHQLNIKSDYDLKLKTREALKTHFGKAGDLYYYFVRGRDQHPVDPTQITQSASAENSFRARILETLSAPPINPSD